MKKFWLLRGLKIAAFIVLAGLAIGFVVMSLWNCLVPLLFGGPVITFFQALGLLILCKILFGGFKGGGHHRCHQCGGGGWDKWKKHGDWKQHLKEKWESKMAGMTPEEKEKFKNKLRNRCGGFFNDDSREEEDITK